MDTRKAIFDFQYSEKMKSGLIIGAGLLEQLAAFKDEAEHSGGKKILVGYLDGLLRELRIAQNVIGLSHYLDLERKLMEIQGRVRMSEWEEARRAISEGISLAATSCQASMAFLMARRLV